MEYSLLPLTGCALCDLHPHQHQHHPIPSFTDCLSRSNWCAACCLFFHTRKCCAFASDAFPSSSPSSSSSSRLPYLWNLFSTYAVLLSAYFWLLLLLLLLSLLTTPTPTSIAAATAAVLLRHQVNMNIDVCERVLHRTPSQAADRTERERLAVVSLYWAIGLQQLATDFVWWCRSTRAKTSERERENSIWYDVTYGCTRVRMLLMLVRMCMCVCPFTKTNPSDEMQT